MIKTQEFAPSQEDFILLSFLYLLRTWGWLHGLLFVVTLIFVILAGDLIVLAIWLALWILLPVFYGFYFAQQAYSRGNEALFRRRYFDITDEFITSFAEDGASERLRWDYIVRVWKFFRYYLVFPNNAMFVLLPHDAFQSEADHQRFVGWMIQHGLRR
ncbi:MAG: YcxB family protein [Anaerolineales bacterium]